MDVSVGLASIFAYRLFFLLWSVFLFAVFTAVYFFFRIGQDKNVIQFLLNGSDTARILTFYNVLDLFWKREGFLFDDLIILDDIYRDVVIDETKYVQIDLIDGALDLDNVFFAHLVAAGVLDDGYTAVEFVQTQIFVNFHAFAGFDMIQHKAFLNSTNTYHTSTSRSFRINAIRT